MIGYIHFALSKYQMGERAIFLETFSYKASNCVLEKKSIKADPNLLFDDPSFPALLFELFTCLLVLNVEI